jgi:hypothetical protein
MIPNITPLIYLNGIQQTAGALSGLIGSTRWAYEAFWADPIGQADLLERQAAAAGMTAAAVFEGHAATIAYLAAVAPDRLGWFSPPPIQVPFLEDGSIDREELATLWDVYQATLPEPEEPEA